MRTFTLLLCLATCLVATLAAPSQDDDLDKQWKESKEPIMKRLAEFQAKLEKQLADTQAKALTADAAEKPGLEERIAHLKKEVQTSKLVIGKLKAV